MYNEVGFVMGTFSPGPLEFLHGEPAMERATNEASCVCEREERERKGGWGIVVPQDSLLAAV